MKLEIDPERDYYAILGVPPDADEQTIKRAYRQLARRYHPDAAARRTDQPEPAGQADQAEPTVEDGSQAPASTVERFREIQEAYELLNDPQQREAYDHWRRQEGLDRPPAFVLSTILSHELLPCLGESQTLYVLVKISAAEEIESRRMPLNLCLVLDRSTSMKGARLQQVKEAARYIVDQLGDNDILSVISFSDRAEIVRARPVAAGQGGGAGGDQPYPGRWRHRAPAGAQGRPGGAEPLAT